MRNELALWFDPAKCLINGEWTAPSGGGTLPLFNPSTGEERGD
jgi:aldehyde dehydrogenase (NAD+)